MEEKFETLWLRYKRPIFGYLLAHACQPADAEDLLQIVAYKALKNFSSLRNPAKFYSWIFRHRKACGCGLSSYRCSRSPSH